MQDCNLLLFSYYTPPWNKEKKRWFRLEWRTVELFPTLSCVNWKTGKCHGEGVLKLWLLFPQEAAVTGRNFHRPCCVCRGCALTALCFSRSCCACWGRGLIPLFRLFLRIVSAVGNAEVISPSETEKACLLPTASGDFLKLRSFLRGHSMLPMQVSAACKLSCQLSLTQDLWFH